jgi:hypothetical protein
MSAPKKKPTRAEQERAAAEQRRLAPVLREAHARLRLWRLCDDQTCRRSKTCGGDADQCGARVAAQGWEWLHHLIKAMREGKAQEAAIQAANQAVLGYRQRCVVRWPHVPYWDDIEFVQLADGSWEHANKAPSACSLQGMVQLPRVRRIEPANALHGDVVEWPHAAAPVVV